MTKAKPQKLSSKRQSGLQPKDQAILSKLHGHSRKALMQSVIYLLALLLLVPAFIGSLAFDYALVHEALLTLLSGTGQNADILAMTFVVAVGALHFLSERPDGEALKAWLVKAVQRAVPVYLIGFGALLAFTTLQFVAGDTGLPDFGVPKEQDDWDQKVSDWAKQALIVIIALAEPFMMILVGLAMASLFVMSVFVGQSCFLLTVLIIGAFIEARSTFSLSKALKTEVESANARVVAAARAAEKARSTKPGDAIRAAKDKIVRAERNALADLRRLIRNAELSKVEDEAEGTEVIEVPSLKESHGLELVSLPAARKIISDIDAIIAPAALRQAAKAALAQTEFKENDNE